MLKKIKLLMSAENLSILNDRLVRLHSIGWEMVQGTTVLFQHDVSAMRGMIVTVKGPVANLEEVRKII